MHSRSQDCSRGTRATTVPAVIKRAGLTAKLTVLALVLLWAVNPGEAFAQLPRLGGGLPGGLPGVGGGVSVPNVGGIGGGLIPDAGSSLPSVPDNSVNLGIRIPTDFGVTVPAVPGVGSVDPLRAVPNVGGITNSLVNPRSNIAGSRNDAPIRSGVPPVGERRFVGDEVVLRLPSNLSRQVLDELAGRHRLARLDSQTIGLTKTTIHRWRITDQRSVSDVIRAIEADRGIGAAQPNYRFTLQQSGPQPAADIASMQYALAKLRLPEAHRLSTGSKVLVAVVDSGIDVSHPELADTVAGSFDAVNSSQSADNHGTAMAGAIVAHASLKGVAPAARILAVRAFTKTEGTTSTIVTSIDWAVAHGARVINMSFAGPNDPEIARALAAARQKGVVLVAAAGNAGPKSPPLYPAADPSVIAVTATDAEDHLFAVANRGRHIAVAAPGVDILGPAPGGGYQMSTGTSVAAAHVSGVVALLLSLQRTMTPDAVRKLLLSTAMDLGPKGRDDQFGAGLADPYRAIVALKAPAVSSVKKNDVSAAQ
jgi:subtilisin family serine protease